MRSSSTPKNLKLVPDETKQEVEDMKKKLAGYDKQCQQAMVSNKAMPLDKAEIEKAVERSFVLQRQVITFASGISVIKAAGADGGKK